MRTTALLALLSLPLAVPLSAQWQNIRTPNVPRLADGKPNLSAPAPRTPDGKPDLTGIWNPNAKFLRNMAVDLGNDGVLMRPWAEELFNVRASGALSHLEPDANCLPQGTPKIGTAPAPWKLLQYPEHIVILYEAFTQYRQIFVDGRKPPVDPNPTWFGYSIGHWEGDTLVVETSGFNGRIWLDQLGHPSTEQMKVTERFRRKDFGHMEITVTIDDLGAYAQPWTVVQDPTLLVDSELIEFICPENEQDIKHMKPKQ